jgi:hypothetical protein
MMEICHKQANMFREKSRFPQQMTERMLWQSFDRELWMRTVKALSKNQQHLVLSAQYIDISRQLENDLTK